MKKIKNIIIILYKIPILIIKILISDRVFFFPFYHTGGAEKVHLDILKYLNKKNNLVIFTGTSYNKHYFQEFKKYSIIFELKKFGDNKLVNFIIKKILKVSINVSKPILFSCNNYFFYDLITEINSRIIKIDLLHAFTYPDKGGTEIYSINKVELLNKRVVINQKTKNDYLELYKKNNVQKNYLERIKIINICVQVPTILPIKNYKKEKLEVIYCGRIAKEKRVHLIIEAAIKSSAFSNLNIFGPKAIELNNLNYYYKKNITDEKEIEKVYQNADILILTSYREGFPVVIKEAMANGVVCISTDVGSINENIIHGKNGFLIKSEKSEEIISEIVEILNVLHKDRVLLRTLSENAYNHALKNFDIEKFKLEINKIL